MNTRVKKYISSTVSYHDFADACNIASNLNLGVEISRFGSLAKIEEDYEKNKKEYKAILRDFEGEVSLHGFFSGLSVVAKDPSIAAISKKRYYQSLELAMEFGAKTVVFHTCFNNLLKQKKYQEMYFLRNIEFYREFILEFEREGIVAAIENVHEPNPTMIRNLVAAINSPNLKTTLDIGHCNLHSDMSPSDWIKEYGIMLHHMHFHNNFKDEDSHSSLLKGSIDIKEIIKTLKELQIYPSITFEIFNQEDLFESVDYLDSICAQVGYY